MSQALTALKEHKVVTWITDRGFDDVAVWRTMWEQHEHVVCRIYHTERPVALQDAHGQGIQGNRLCCKNDGDPSCKLGLFW